MGGLSMQVSVLTVLFGCKHRKTTFPLTRTGAARPDANGTFVTCVDCGKEFRYDWETMRIGEAVKRPQMAAGEHQIEACARRVVVRSS
jgi:hypothetical protein